MILWGFASLTAGILFLANRSPEDYLPAFLLIIGGLLGVALGTVGWNNRR
tara:strand:- start:3584 stop:3733 length:150 start_codon:yes stop_codon:yes gene_type:complete